MRLPLFLIGIVCFGNPVFGGVAQDAFHRLVAGASSVSIERTRDHSVILSSSTPKKIAQVVAAIDLVDPVVERSKDGEEIIVLTCFCVADYVVRFQTPGGERQLFIKHRIGAVFGSENLGLGYDTDVKLSGRSARALKRLIRRAESSR